MKRLKAWWCRLINRPGLIPQCCAVAAEYGSLCDSDGHRAKPGAILPAEFYCFLCQKIR